MSEMDVVYLSRAIVIVMFQNVAIALLVWLTRKGGKPNVCQEEQD